MIVGVDYSMTCPAMCLRRADTSREFWCSLGRKTPYTTVPEHVTVNYHQQTDVIPRAHELAEAVLAQLQVWNIHPGDHIAIEDYAYAASGRVFHIGEHGGILKHQLFLNGYEYQAVAPTQAKKLAGKGNFDKVAMTDAFFRTYPEAQHWPAHFFNLDKKKTIYDSPITDLADAFWIAEYVWSRTVAAAQ